LARCTPNFSGTDCGNLMTFAIQYRKGTSLE
jgi:hypothetical protein